MPSHPHARGGLCLALALAALAAFLGAAPAHSESVAARSGTSAKAEHRRPIARSSTSPAATVTEVALRLGSVTSGMPVTGTIVLTASRPVTARSVGLAVRGASGRRYDFPGAATRVNLGTGHYTYTSQPRTFAAGKYTVFGFWETSSGVYHHLRAARITVAPAPAASSASEPLPSSSEPLPSSSASLPSSSGSPPSSSVPLPKGMPGAWTLKEHDEFNGTALDTTKWQPGWFGSGVTGPANTAEQACYSPANVTFPGDGTVHLAVTATPATCGGSTRPYTGALLSSNPQDGRPTGGYQYTYGALEARVYLPGSAGQVANWPAVWTDGQSWPTDGEDDLLEGLSGKACFHFHSPSGGPGSCATGNQTGWHTVASDWEPGSVTYYYDGVEVGRITTGVTAAPMYLILSNTVSASTGGPTVAGAEMQVDYVRAWQH